LFFLSLLLFCSEEASFDDFLNEKKKTRSRARERKKNVLCLPLDTSSVSA